MTYLIRTARSAFVAFVLGTATVAAQEQPQSWIPPEITLPDDMEITIDRSIGSANRIFSFSTAEDADSMAATWRAVLEEGPYQVKPAAEGMDQRLIEFSGGRIRNGQITFVSGAASTGTTVQFDASLND
ncbi:MAG: hypothetical protein ACU0B7_04835 [Paracoccaceae bacterium]|uniref:hypothetical protein n=1 Tax=Seohaeicola saemankumensis TaxID=481181 RepID=UPI001E3A73AF|nr:hypothetical protein [Seohaeicola saemankumensis]MCD1626476.1 hypothetical protein [Seohaeicola saemankumensis]